MIKLTSQDRELLTDEVLNLSRKLNNDIINNITSHCEDLEEMSQDIAFVSNECDKIKRLNDKAYDLYQDTVNICDDLKNLICDIEIIENSGW